MQSAAAPLLVGYLSHLAADACTPSGVPLLWPKRKTYSLNLFPTGSLAEYGFVGVLAVATFQLIQLVG
jgi:inner membrane protein